MIPRNRVGRSRVVPLLSALLLVAAVPALGGGVSSAVTSSWQRQSPVPTGQTLFC